MGRLGTAGADSGAGRTRLIDAMFHQFADADLPARSILATHEPRLRVPLDLAVWETEFCRQRLAGEFRPRTPGERSEFGSQTRTRLANRPELRGFPPTWKPRRFAGTGWWAMQGSNLRPLPCEGSNGGSTLEAEPETANAAEAGACQGGSLQDKIRALIGHVFSPACYVTDI